MALIRGIDISGWQSVHNWTAVAADVEYVLVKCSESTGYVSSAFRPLWTAARAVGLLVGSYHFAQIGNAKAEASHYVSCLRDIGWTSGRDLPPMLDLERDGGLSSSALNRWAQDFCEEVDSSFGLTDPWLKCGIYVNGSYRSRVGGALRGRWLMYASWPNRTRHSGWPAESDRPTGAAIWQFTDQGLNRVSGISGSGLDLDVAREEDLRRLAPAHYGEPMEDDMQLSDRVEFLPGEAERGHYGSRKSLTLRSLIMHAAIGGRKVRYEVIPALADIQGDIANLAKPMSDKDREALAASIAARVDKLRVEISRELAQEDEDQ